MSIIDEKVDLAMLAQLRDLLGERFVELVNCFCHDGQRRVDLLRGAVDPIDFDTLYAEAHGLKGSSNNVGANNLGRFCEALEHKGRLKDGEDLGKLFAAVEQEFAAVCSALRESL